MMHTATKIHSHNNSHGAKESDQEEEDKRKLLSDENQSQQSMETNTDELKWLQNVNGGAKSSYLTPLVKIKMGSSSEDRDPGDQRSEQQRKMMKTKSSLKKI